MGKAEAERKLQSTNKDVRCGSKVITRLWTEELKVSYEELVDRCMGGQRLFGREGTG